MSVMTVNLKSLWKMMDISTPKAVYVTWNQKTLVSEFKGGQTIEATKQGVTIFPKGKQQLLKFLKDGHIKT